jgi:hypothetical protein
MSFLISDVPVTCPPCTLVNLYIDAEKPPFLHKCPKRTHWCSTSFCMLTLRYLGISYIILYPPWWNPDEYIIIYHLSQAMSHWLIIYRWFSDIPSFLWSSDQLGFALSGELPSVPLWKTHTIDRYSHYISPLNGTFDMVLMVPYFSINAPLPIKSHFLMLNRYFWWLAYVNI